MFFIKILFVDHKKSISITKKSLNDTPDQNKNQRKQFYDRQSYTSYMFVKNHHFDPYISFQNLYKLIGLRL